MSVSGSSALISHEGTNGPEAVSAHLYVFAEKLERLSLQRSRRCDPDEGLARERGAQVHHDARLHGPSPTYAPGSCCANDRVEIV